MYLNERYLRNILFCTELTVEKVQIDQTVVVHLVDSGLTQCVLMLYKSHCLVKHG